jgi:hypothetical protein
MSRQCQQLVGLMRIRAERGGNRYDHWPSRQRWPLRAARFDAVDVCRVDSGPSGELVERNADMGAQGVNGGAEGEGDGFGLEVVGRGGCSARH